MITLSLRAKKKMSIRQPFRANLRVYTKLKSPTMPLREMESSTFISLNRDWCCREISSREPIHTAGPMAHTAQWDTELDPQRSVLDGQPATCISRWQKRAAL